MSRSFSRAERRRLIRSGRPAQVECVRIDYGEAAPEPEVITPEWAVERMSEQICFMVGNLIDEGHIDAAQSEDYLNLFSQTVVEALPKYDPERRNAQGRTSSAVHFLRIVLDRKVKKVIESIAVAKNLASFESIEDERTEETEDDVEELSAPPWASDCGRCVADIEWRLDMEAMMRRLPREARIALGMIIMGYDHVEVIAATVRDRNAYWRKVIPLVQKVLREGGYGPHAER